MSHKGVDRFQGLNAGVPLEIAALRFRNKSQGLAVAHILKNASEKIVGAAQDLANLL